MASRKKVAKLFWTGRSQAVRLPQEFRFDGDAVLVHREGQAVILEPSNSWPDDYVESFKGVADDFQRPVQNKLDRRTKLG
jgi:antitoxin VapB